MNKEEIKLELVRRCTKISESEINIQKSNEPFGILNNLATVKEYAETNIIDELNKILKEKNIVFKDNEKSELILYLKPSIIALITSYIRK